MRISKVGGRASPISLRVRKALRYVSITTLLFALTVLNSVQMMPLYYDQEAVRLQDVMRQKFENESHIDASSTRQEQSNSQHFVSTSKPSVVTLLRLDWTNQVPQSPLARRIQQHQMDCSLPLGNFKFRNRFGLGSDLHVWSQAMCNAMHFGVRIRTVWDWLWMDQQSCQSIIIEENKKTKRTLGSPLQCYFPRAELQCPSDSEIVLEHPIFDSALFNISGGRRQGTVNWDCSSILSSESGDGNEMQRRFQFQEAGMEFLFGQISQHVVEEANRQHFLVFGSGNTSQTTTPNDLITVHIRWGDKKREMKLLQIQQYLNAIDQLVQGRPRPVVNVFLATEDPEAVQQFQQQAPTDWKIYIDQFYTELLPHRNGNEYNGVPKAATALEGRMGTIALGSLLVALEANEFVITTESNWSRLLNELRKSIVDPTCHGCTKVMDLKPIQSI
ncbi:unnamed protein product [Cylindrotheca closterium]|uniref:Uncharacterized protein n=1 Tax=Cylindrotheca closterium TaxID=2856 RepID=A0AAD2CT43_9STRA|nr:unnamed protein product [Cylindrotheca closterium]